MIEDAELVDDTKPCPFCGETIKQIAIKCRFCGELIGNDELPGLFRKGNQLVMHRRANLPARCLKTNLPADRWLERTVNWHPPFVTVLMLLGPLPFIVGFMVTRKQARLNIPMSEARFWRRRFQLLIAWFIVLVGISLFVAGVMNTGMRRDELVAWLILSGIASFLIGVIFAVIIASPVAAAKMTASHVWLKKVHPEVLDMLPVWPED